MVFILVFVVVAIAVQRIAELRLAEKNRALAISQGAVEFGANHYFLFVILHTSWIIGWVTEGYFNIESGLWSALSDITSLVSITAGILFLLAQVLRYWAITSLGTAWNTRILVVKDANLVQQGPYKFLKHPNYIAVVIELASVPMIFFAWKTALVASILNALLLLFIRIPAENQALHEYLRK